MVRLPACLPDEWFYVSGMKMDLGAAAAAAAAAPITRPAAQTQTKRILMVLVYHIQTKTQELYGMCKCQCTILHVPLVSPFVSWIKMLVL